MILRYFVVEEDPPDYDVTERVKQLNQELAKEPDPDDDRERSIKFKEKVVDFEVPPDDYSEDEGADGKKPSDDNKDELSSDISDTRESTDHTNDASGDITEDSADPVSATATQEQQPSSDNEDDLDNNDSHNNTIDHDEQSHGDNEQQQDSNNIGDYNNDVGVNDDVDNPSPPSDLDDENEKTDNSQESTSTKKGTGDKILVERDGKFELLNSEDLTAEEKDLYLAKNDDDETEKSTGRESSMGDSTFRSSDSSASTEISFQPHPPANQRPATAAGRKARQNSSKPRRAQSAQNERFLDNFSYVSPYAISDEDKKQSQKNKKHNEKLEKQKKEKEKQDQVR